MAIQNDPLQIKQGADYVYGFNVSDGAGNPIDLSDGVVTGQIRAYAGGALYATFTATVTDPAMGIGIMSLTAKQTRAIPATAKIPWKHDAFFLRSDGVTIPIVGTTDVNVEAAVTTS